MGNDVDAGTDARAGCAPPDHRPHIQQHRRGADLHSPVHPGRHAAADTAGYTDHADWQFHARCGDDTRATTANMAGANGNSYMAANQCSVETS